MQFRKTLILLLVSITCIAQQSKKKQRIDITNQKLSYFLQLTDSLREIGRNPGLSMAIIHNNKVIYKKSTGFRNLKKNLSVTNNTLFEIGSLSKGFTGMLAAQLTDDETINWNDKVASYIPKIKFQDSYVTENATIKDLLTHKTGLYQHYHLLFGPKLTRQKILEILPYMDFGSSFRENFYYNNFTYVLAGMLLEHTTKKSFEYLLQEKIFNKLGMLNTFPFFSTAIKQKEIATGYLYDGTTPAPKPQENNAVFSPAGTIVSSLNDMSIWLQTLINKGKHKKTSIVSEKQFNYITSPLVVRNTTDSRFYGIGWDVIKRDKYLSISHDGVTDGQRSRILFIPEFGFGIVVLTNQNNALPSMLTLLAERIFIKKNSFNHSDIFNYQKNSISKNNVPYKIYSLKNSSFLKSHKGISGTYTHPAYGSIQLRIKDSTKILFQYYGFKGSIKQEKNATFFAYVNHYLGKEKYKIQFHKNKQKNITSITVSIPYTKPLNFIKTR